MEIHSTPHQSFFVNSTVQFQNSGTPSKATKEDGSAPQAKPGSDTVSISAEASEKSQESKNSINGGEEAKDLTGQQLTKEELAKVQELKERDAEVRAHEQAHLAAAGGHATGGASYTLQKGPDGRSYAVGGEVGIDMSKESDPSATIAKMQTVQRAALAPANPSSTDRQVAAQAAVKEAQARQELLQEQQEELLAAEESVNDPSGIQASPQQQVPDGITAGSLKASISAYEKISALE